MMAVAIGARRRGSDAASSTTSSWDEVIEFYLRCGFTITHVDDGVFGRDTWFEKWLALPEGDGRRAAST